MTMQYAKHTIEYALRHHVGKTISGSHFNKLTFRFNFAKPLNKLAKHGNISYSKGLVFDIHELKSQSNTPGGLHFVHVKDFHNWLYYNKEIGVMYWIAKITIPERAKVFIESYNDFKADIIIIDDLVLITDDKVIMAQIFSNNKCWQWISGMRDEDADLHKMLCASYPKELMATVSDSNYMCHAHTLANINVSVDDWTTFVLSNKSQELYALVMCAPASIRQQLIDNLHGQDSRYPLRYTESMNMFVWVNWCLDLIQDGKYALISRVMPIDSVDFWCRMLASSVESFVFLPQKYYSAEFFNAFFGCIEFNSSGYWSGKHSSWCRRSKHSSCIPAKKWDNVFEKNPEMLRYLFKHIPFRPLLESSSTTSDSGLSP